MNLRRLTLSCAVLLGLSAALAAKTVSVTGTVTDTMCGLHHMMKGAAKCTRECVKSGSGYALILRHKVYKLTGLTPAETHTLYLRAGRRVTVTGSFSGKFLHVNSLRPAK